ncbi:uncharacterized protein C8R40DRAFT_1171340 [Lentinula edodes]|uniref:uncharacterized protein n=1 Tax=Lentinula edodes TaxID=5353 RepID=UPI001E8E1C34|nr:uncharacterized protein C8R40DRAFT_1171340 [Lentinula edodes]KAH7874742.1 hypothetical protein C8R40DRAFT_1171340 [Lentinula edodes]
MLNILLLIACICITIASFLYFFYFNRLIAWFIGLVIRLVYWNDGASSIWLEIGSIHFSILSGRILFKNVRYHSSNQTVKIVKGQVAWRYWIRRPTTEEEIGMSLGGGGKIAPRDSSCRIQITLHGFEWFLYNRTAAYDNILAQMRSHNPVNSQRRTSLHKSSGLNTPVAAASLVPSSLRTRTPIFLTNLVTWIRGQLPNLDPKDLLPLGIDINKGAIICGNPSTPNLLVAEFQHGSGTFGIVPSRSKYDLYKQMLTLKFKQALVQFVENEHYRDSMTSTGETIENQINNYDLRTPSTLASYHTFAKIWDSLKLYAPVLKYLSANPRRVMLPTSHLRRRANKKSLDEDTPLGIDFSKFEYAIERKILETSLLELCYYTDVVGLVPRASITQPSASDPFDIGNGDIGPEWGVDIAVNDGTLKYGPWADRQRGELQRTFFPPVYSDSQESQRLQPGDSRVWTAMRVFLELRGETTLHVPLRESSKNWQWDGVVKETERPRKREPAYLHLTAGDRSSISYLMPMVASKRGYEPILEVHLDTVTMTSSLNDIRLVSAESCRVHCELPSPLKWKAQRTWNVGVTLRRPTLYLIRDHINMFTDLGKDWSSGSPHDYQRFIPMIYQIQLDMHYYELNLYANDQNIIDKPLVEDENAIFTLAGVRFSFNTTIPSNVYRPESTTVPLSIDVPDVSLKLSLPRWNTNALHAPKKGNTLAKVGSFHMDGSYLYFADFHEEHVEQLVLTMKVRDIIFKSLGWSIRYFMILRDNYLGSFTHFSTLYEYLRKQKRGAPLGDPVNNMMQVELGINVLDGFIVLPVGLPGYEIGLDMPAAPPNSIGRCVVITMPELNLQLRLHDLYMEMTLNIGTISSSIEEQFPETLTYPEIKAKKAHAVLIVDGIDIVANRLFGPVPRTITYVCLWEIHVGGIKASLSAYQATVFQAAVRALGINFTDPLNAPADQYQTGIYPDITFVKVSLETVEILWKAGCATAHVSVHKGLKFDYNDLGGQFHKKLTSIRLPHLSVKALLDYNASNTWLEAAEIVTDVFLDIYSSPAGWHEMSATQADFVWEQDRPTGRVDQLITMLKTTRSVSGQWTLTSAFAITMVIADPGIRKHLKNVYMPQPTNPRQNAYSRRHYEHHPRSDIGPIDDVVQSSESDGENPSGFADTIRAARPLFSSHTPDEKNEEESLSIGDESDNEDLTDRSDGEWSDSDNEPDSNARALKQYVHLVRHYILHRGDSPSLWEEGPFIPIRENQFAYAKKHLNAERSNWTPFAFEPPDNSKNTITVKFSQHDGIDLKLTPLIVNVLEALQSDLESTHFNAEYLTDRWLSSYIGDFPDPSKPKVSSRTILDIHSESVALHVLHRLDVIENGPVHKNDYSGRFAYLVFTASNIQISGNVSVENRSIAARFARTDMDLTSVHSDGRAAAKQPALSFSVLEFQTTLFKDNHEFSCAKLTAELSHSLPSLLISVANAVEGDLPRLVRLRKRASESSSNVIRSTIYHILHSSSNELVIDPLSTIQPSFLVQVGLPQMLRVDPAFRFLFHLRDCLWRLREVNPTWDMDRIEAQKVTIDDVTPLLRDRLLALDPDAYHTSRLESLQPLLPFIKPATNRRKDETHFSFSYVSIKLNSVELKVADSENRTPCQISLSDMFSGLRLRHHQLLDEEDEFRRLAASQTSLRSKSPDLVQRASVSIVLGDIQTTVYPYLINFVQEIIRAQKLNAGASSAKKLKRARFKPFNVVYIHAVLTIKRFRLRASAEKLTFEFGISELRHSSTVLIHHHSKKQSMNHSLLFTEMFIKARATSEPHEHDDLASLTIADSLLSSVMRNETLDQSIKLAFNLKALRFSVPRSALRLYHFVEQWRADFLSGIESTVQALILEVNKPSTNNARLPQSHSTFPKSSTLQIDGQVSCAGIYLRVMHDTWLSWEVNDISLFLNSLARARQRSHEFGLQLSSQLFAVSTESSEPSYKTRVKFEFPPTLLSGHIDQSSIRITSFIHFLELKVKPSYWDTLLAVQQKFGQDFNDLLVVIQQTRSKRFPAPPASLSKPETTTQTDFSVFVQMEGFRIGFEGRSSVLYLECPGIRSKFEGVPEKAWSVVVTDLALSLAPRLSMTPHSFGLNRHQRSAFVIIDFKIQSESQGSGSEALEVVVTKIHAVMQPSSIGEMGDFIDELQEEMIDRREQRTQELAAFKQKTQRLIKTFEIKNQEPALSDRISWLDNYIIQFSLSNIGVAFPLAHDHDMDLPPLGSHDSTAVRAFLFSIKSVKFGTQRGETGEAGMESLSFQFVPRFRQSVPTDFLGETHDTRNRLLYPTMTAQLRSSKSATFNQIYMTATVSGFVLNMDSTIPDYVFSLFDVYRHGKERVQRLSASIPRGGSSIPNAAVSNRQISHSAASPDIFASLTFQSGKVCMFSTDASKSSRIRAYSGTWDRPEEPIGDVEAEVFNLPVVSVWAEYRAAPPSRQGSNTEIEPSILIFKSTVHSSHNTLRPMLLPFVTEVVTHVEARLRTSTRIDLPSLAVEPAVQTEVTPVPNATSTLRMSFSLRIDQSRLELTCLPDVNVVAAVNWDSGGFMVNVLPGSRDVTFTGVVGGLTIGLKHGFLSEDCLKLDARNLAFSVALGKPCFQDRPMLTSISLVVDTEFLGAVRFSRLQDILCFKAVWLDRIPVFNTHNDNDDLSKIKPNHAPPTTPNNKPEFDIAILVRIRRIKLEVDLGQSISTVTLHLENSNLRTKLTQSFHELSIRVGHLAITAKGNVAGYANVPNCVFQTIQWVGKPPVEDGTRDRMLELRMMSGPLIVMLESDYQKLLHYRAEPLEVDILDDWSIPKSSQTDRPLRLSFTVKSKEVVAIATVGTIPKLLAYANKFKANLEAQREGASRESNTFRISRAPKPDNPLSAVAEAMITSARTRFKEADAILSYTIRQHMSLRLDLLCLVVFPRTMGDAEVAQFVGQDVRGRLNRLIESASTSSKRDIRLSFSFMRISRFTQLGHAIMPPITEISDGRQWLEDLLKDANNADIVGLPSMIMHMASTESQEGLHKTLAYNFDSQFVRLKGVQHSEDIYITLNVGLYSWLTVLRKTLSREMEQVQTAADWRMFAANPVQTRRNIPEPLNLANPPRSATVPSPTNVFSPLSPKSASAVTTNFGSSLDVASLSKSQSEAFAPSPTDGEGEAKAFVYRPGHRRIERLTMRQLGEATPDVMHPFFMKKAGFSLEDSLPQYVHEYATVPLEEIMEVLLRLYSRQLLAATI